MARPALLEFLARVAVQDNKLVVAFKAAVIWDGLYAVIPRAACSASRQGGARCQPPPAQEVPAQAPTGCESLYLTRATVD